MVLEGMVKYEAQIKTGWYLAVNVFEYYERSALIWTLKLIPFLIYFLIYLCFIVSMKK